MTSNDNRLIMSDASLFKTCLMQICQLYSFYLILTDSQYLYNFVLKITIFVPLAYLCLIQFYIKVRSLFFLGLAYHQQVVS